MLAVTFFLAACGGGSDATNSQSQQNTSKQQQTNEPKETVFDPMISTMDRAAGVEDMNMSRKAEMDAAIEGSE